MTARAFFYEPTGRIDAIIGNVAQAAYAAAGTLTNSSTAFDRTALNTTTGKRYNAVILAGQTGAVTGAPTSFTCTYQVQDSADGSTGWTAVGSPLVITAASTASAASVDLSSADRYIRVVVTVAYTGGTTPTLFASSALLGVYDTET